jgi:hypothetical protein
MDGGLLAHRGAVARIEAAGKCGDGLVTSCFHGKTLRTTPLPR